MNETEFQTLRDAPLHRLVPAEWEEWYPRMASYLPARSETGDPRPLVVARLAPDHEE